MFTRASKQIILALTESEARQLVALVDFAPHGMCPVADSLSIDLSNLGVTADESVADKLAEAFVV